MNIENKSIDVNKVNNSSNVRSNSRKDSVGGTSFAEELNSGRDVSKKEEDSKRVEEDKKNKVDEKDVDKEETISEEDEEKPIDDVISGLEETVEEIQNLNQKDENSEGSLKDEILNSDISNKKEDNSLINNDFNIQDKQDAQLNLNMNLNMNFNSEGKPFNEFMNPNKENGQLLLNEKDLLEEQAILSTMSENIAIANRNKILNENSVKENDNINENRNPFASKVKTVSDSEGIKKVDKKSNVTVETVVKYDNLIMNEADVDLFSKLVENGSVDMSENVKQTQKSVQVSKTLADMLAKSMKDNQPIRIDFDNNISVIIKVSKEGKISADFLPSSQIAEAYLKENLPLLKQRFDENNIQYDELNQRKQRQEDKDNRKKGRKDE